MKTVIFDLDGTLADTSGDLIAAANACFHALGAGDLLDPAQDSVTAFAGGRAMLRLGLERLNGHAPDEAEVDAHFPRFLASYGENIDRYSVLYPGSVEAVAQLRSAGFATGICTNKPEALAETLLERLGVREHFGSLIGADTLATRKPDPAPLRAAITRAGGDPAQAILVGDTVTDRETARAAGVPCVLVTFGAQGQGVSTLKPEALLDSYADLPALAGRLLG